MTTAYDAIVSGRVKHFTLEEWPEPWVLKHVEEEVILTLDELRLRYREVIYPSRDPGGWARMGGSKTSRHYAGEGRLADAADIFPAGSVLDCWLEAIAMDCFGGVGLYLDTRQLPHQPGAMIHLDLRPAGEPIFWVRNEVGDYIYKHKTATKFWDAVARVQQK